MKRLPQILPALLLAVALAGCSVLPATQTESPAPAVTAEPVQTPTATPAPAQDLSAGVEYEMLSLPTTPQPPFLYDSGFMPKDETAHSNGLTLVEALYTNDADKLRSVLSDSLLDSSLPLPDLTGLVITDIFLGGGQYEAPFALLTIADAGATGLPVGQHEFRFLFDGEGKVMKFSPRGEDLTDEEAAGMGLEPGEWMELQRVNARNDYQEEVYSFSGIRVVGHKLDVLGFSIGEVRAFATTEHWTSDENNLKAEYAMTSCRKVPGDWPAPRDFQERYGTPPTGNCLSDAELERVCTQLNTLFSRLLDGSYTTEWQDDPVQAIQNCWNAARPVPVKITPDVLRSCVDRPENPELAASTRVWVPLPDGCWAVTTLSQYDDTGLSGTFNFVLTAPEGV